MGYTLNANGWRTAIARPGGKDDAYTYDTTGQVLTAAAANTAGPTTESFAYDLAGNRTGSTATPPDGVQGDTPMIYAANALDQYTSLNGQAQTHDANGNTLLLRQPTQDDVTFTWDSENRMLVQERGGSDPARIVNHYDALHRRVRKEIYEKPGGTFVLVKTHTFIYDGWNVIEERQFNSGGTLTALTRLTWGADLSGSMQGAGGVGGLLMAEEMDLADIDPPVAHYYWYDGNGNVTGITDDSGTIEGTYRYTSFGAFAETAKTTAFAEDQPWKFSTKYHDTEVEPVAGTYYYGYRSYLPSVGRWPSRDPIEEKGGLNVYVFTGNAVVNQIDYLGLDSYTLLFTTLIRPGDPEPGEKTSHRITFDEYGRILLHWEVIGVTPVFGLAPVPGGGTITPATITGNHPHFSVNMKASVYSMPLRAAGWLAGPGVMIGPVTHLMVIDYDVTIDLDLCSRQGLIRGWHDGYPSYTLRVGGQGVVYDFHQRPGIFGLPGLEHLLPPMEIPVDRSFSF